MRKVKKLANNKMKSNKIWRAMEKRKVMNKRFQKRLEKKTTEKTSKENFQRV